MTATSAGGEPGNFRIQANQGQTADHHHLPRKSSRTIATFSAPTRYVHPGGPLGQPVARPSCVSYFLNDSTRFLAMKTGTIRAQVSTGRMPSQPSFKGSRTSTVLHN